MLNIISFPFSKKKYYSIRKSSIEKGIWHDIVERSERERGKNEKKIKDRCRQDSNLRGETPMDFKSIALTTRPPQLLLTFAFVLLFS